MLFSSESLFFCVERVSGVPEVPADAAAQRFPDVKEIENFCEVCRTVFHSPDRRHCSDPLLCELGVTYRLSPTSAAVSYFPEVLAQVWTKCAYVQLCLWRLYSRQFSLNPNSNTMELDRPQHDPLAACVIVQQHSFATFSSLGFILARKILLRLLRTLRYKGLNLKFPNLKLRKPGSFCMGDPRLWNRGRTPRPVILHF